MNELQLLSDAVQKNCDISDAQYAGDYTLCVYLLKMREYYRWEQGLAVTNRLSNKVVGDWLIEREQLWKALETQPFACLPVDGDCLDPFDAQAINAWLVPQRLVYSAGVGRFCKPHFFLGRLSNTWVHQGFTIYLSDDEYARDLTAPPAMLQGEDIFVRRESVRRMLWEKVEEWNWKPQENALSRAMGDYGFERDPEGALEVMTDRELQFVVLHELGEGLAGKQLGVQWADMMSVIARRRAELYARAIRDHIADCNSTLPGLFEMQHPASVHFYFANFKGMRKTLFPQLEQAYQVWQEHSDTQPLKQAIQWGQTYWSELAEGMLQLFRKNKESCAPAIEEMVHQAFPDCELG
jgi:hypothetical protein